VLLLLQGEPFALALCTPFCSESYVDSRPVTFLVLTSLNEPLTRADSPTGNFMDPSPLSVPQHEDRTPIGIHPRGPERRPRFNPFFLPYHSTPPVGFFFLRFSVSIAARPLPIQLLLPFIHGNFPNGHGDDFPERDSDQTFPFFPRLLPSLNSDATESAFEQRPIFFVPFSIFLPFFSWPVSPPDQCSFAHFNTGKCFLSHLRRSQLSIPSSGASISPPAALPLAKISTILQSLSHTPITNYVSSWVSDASVSNSGVICVVFNLLPPPLWLFFFDMSPQKLQPLAALLVGREISVVLGLSCWPSICLVFFVLLPM